eukprot:10024636-Lingulodinium_polyedra.AAC.1
MALVLSRALLLTCALAHANASCCAGHHPQTRKRRHTHTHKRTLERRLHKTAQPLHAQTKRLKRFSR